MQRVLSDFAIGFATGGLEGGLSLTGGVRATFERPVQGLQPRGASRRIEGHSRVAYEIMPAAEGIDGYGAWYDEKQGDSGDLWHRTLIDPSFQACLGQLPAGARVLDVGCGNGYIARKLARGGARVVAVDLCAELISRARAREAQDRLGIVYLLQDAAALGGIEDSSIDVAVANMSLMDIEDGAGAIREIGRVVVDGGRFVFSISHPCFDVDTRSAWSLETAMGRQELFRKVTGYRSVHSDRYRWKLGDSTVASTVGYHRPLGWYAKALREGGWVIESLAEPEPTPDYVGIRVMKEWLEQIPLHLIVGVRRSPRKH